jgi:sulfatase modifying factor 1
MMKRFSGAFVMLLVAACSGGAEPGAGGTQAGATEAGAAAGGAPAAPTAEPAAPPPGATPAALPVAAELTPLVTIPAGSWRPFYPGKDEPPLVEVGAFQLEEHAVTNRQYLAFVQANPQWRKSQVATLFADGQYLDHWTGDLEFPPECADAPVVNVSWFAARSYAAWIGRRLPTLAEWENAARASEGAADGSEEAGFKQRILDWYAQLTPAIPPPVRSGYRNVHGAWDLHGLLWEWVEDFNTALVTGESRGNAGLDRDLFCGSGSVGSVDPSDYASFMRYALRSSLDANYGLQNLGFRCAADLDAAAEVAHDCCAALEPELATELPTDSLWRVGATWQDQRGIERTLDEFRGSVVVSAMIFTHCAYACPRTMSDLIAMREALPAETRAQVRWLLVSFDDVRDVPERLAVFAAEQKLDDSWTLLHGGPEAVRTWAAAMGVRYKKTPDGAFSHSNRISLLDPSGRVAAHWDGLGVPPEPAAKEIAALVASVSAPQ